ncbi:hypothetical protein QQ054_26815 [Oscillatoria amoena NRMC-F 0135]|nr:hypothetical protein [Oscillatoria amoena NRMC-F 0135]
MTTIDIKKEAAKDGDILNVYLKWNGFSKNGSLPPLPIVCQFVLKKTGWMKEITESFLLIERINEQSPNVKSNTSPSNFKGTYGVSLMWTYNSTDHIFGKDTVGTVKDLGGNSYSYSKIKTNKVMNFLEPSIGINVSYLDFSTSDDFEIGLGPIFGLFANQIFVGSGINLNQIRSGGNPIYFSLGFSFINVAQKIADLTKQSGTQ